MNRQVTIRHQTRYNFDRLVTIMPHMVRLRPAPHCRTPINRYQLYVEPASHFIHWQQDPFANHVARLVFSEPSDALELCVELTATLVPVNPFDFFVEPDATDYPFKYPELLLNGLAPYRHVDDSGPALLDWVAAADTSPQNTIDFLVAENRRTQQAIDYTHRLDAGVQSCDETLRHRRGSCRDSSWLLLQTLRHLGLAARFVSGYMIDVAGEHPTSASPGEAGATDLHAWVEAFIPGAGWIGLDPTSGLMATEGHIPLACAPEPDNAAPVTGSTGICEVNLEFSNEIIDIRDAE